jgi:dsRNA-specific ribonuclease
MLLGVSAASEILGYVFEDERLLESALAAQGTPFQRMEFLGDSVLDALVVTSAISPEVTARGLDATRRVYASDAALASVAHETGLARVSSSTSDSRHADVVEAVMGAAFLDGGWAAADVVASALGLMPHEVSGSSWSHPSDDVAWAADVAGAMSLDATYAASLCLAHPASAHHRALASVGCSIFEVATSILMFESSAGDEGVLSRGRNRMTSNKRLARWSTHLELGPFETDRSAADVTQAVIGALAVMIGIEIAVTAATSIALSTGRAPKSVGGH